MAMDQNRRRLVIVTVLLLLLWQQRRRRERERERERQRRRERERRREQNRIREWDRIREQERRRALERRREWEREHEQRLADVRHVTTEAAASGVVPAAGPIAGESSIDDYFARYRMTPKIFGDLLRRIEPRITMAASGVGNDRLSAPKERLEATLRYLASGDSFTTLSYAYHVESETLMNIVVETMQAIWDSLKDEYVPVPTRAEWKNISHKFREDCDFPLCVGAIGAKEFTAEDGSNIVLIAVADADYKFTLMEVIDYQHHGDGGGGDKEIFRKTNISQRLEHAVGALDRDGLNLPYAGLLPGGGNTNDRIGAPHVFVGGGDQFPLLRHLMTPYKRQTGSRSEVAEYNRGVSRVRGVVENALGVLITRWRVLLQRRIELDDEAAKGVVKSCLLLHNYLLKSTDSIDHQPRYIPAKYVDYYDDERRGQLIPGEWRLDSEYRGDQSSSSSLALGNQRPNRTAFGVRGKFKNYFASRNESAE